MTFLDAILDVFRAEKPHREYAGLYMELNILASSIARELEALKVKRDELYAFLMLQRKGSVEFESPAIKKTSELFLSFLPELDKFTKEAEARFDAVVSVDSHEHEPSPVEQEWLDKVKRFLEDVKSKLKFEPPKGSVVAQFNFVNNQIRECANLADEFASISKTSKEVSKEHARLVSQLAKKVFDGSIVETHKGANILVYHLSNENELGELLKSAEEVNSANDKRFRVQFRTSGIPVFERDACFDKEHINVNIMWDGKLKKIHLVKTA